MPPKRFTANPVRPARYRPGKAVEEASSSSEEEEDQDEDDAAEADAAAKSSRVPQQAIPNRQQAISNLSNIDLQQRRRQLEIEEARRKREEFEERERMERDAGFVTASESDEEDGEDDEEEDDATSQAAAPTHSTRATANVPKQQQASESESESGSEEDSDSEEESSSDDDDRRKLIRPVFRKTNGTSNTLDGEAQAAADEERRIQQSNNLLQEQIEARQAERQANAREWDDDVAAEAEDIDDTDGIDPEIEHKDWVVRELSRLRRSRLAMEAREAEIAEVERRKHLSAAEREEEDRAYIAAQQDEKASRAKAAALQKYQHKGAFYTGDAEELGLRERDLMGATYVDQSSARETLPEYLQVRDVTKIGRKGRTRYKDLKSEDTGAFGEGLRRKRGDFQTDDDRFKPDAFGEGRNGGGRDGPTGANASGLGTKRRLDSEDDGKKARLKS